MPFEKGVSGNPSGRPVGAKNDLADKEIREFLRTKSTDYFLGKVTPGQPTFVSDMAGLKPSMRVQVWEKYLKYFLPVLAALKVESDVNVNHNGKIEIDFSFGDKDVDSDMQNIINNI